MKPMRQAGEIAPRRARRVSRGGVSCGSSGSARQADQVVEVLAGRGRGGLARRVLERGWLVGGLLCAIATACARTPRGPEGDASAGESLVFERLDGVAESGAERAEARPWAAASWRFGEGASLRIDVHGPRSLASGSRLRASAVAEHLEGCELSVKLIEPVSAAHQSAFRGRAVPRGDRGAFTEAQATIAGDSATLELVIPTPWRAGVAELEAEVVCRDGRQRAVSGPRRELRHPAEGRVRDARLVVAALPISPGGWPIDVPYEGRDGGDAIDGLWVATAAPSWTLVDPRNGDALRGPGADERRTRGLAADTRVGFAWTPEGLIVRAALRDRDLAPLAGGRDTELWKGDALEVFLAHADREAYVELQTAATGELFDARFIARRQAGAAPDAGVAWDGHTRVGVKLDGTLARGDEDRGWDVELLVPWSDLRGVGVIDDVAAAGVRLRANVFRVERDADGRMSAASLAPTRESDFHAMGEAPTLVLAGGAGS